MATSTTPAEASSSAAAAAAHSHAPSPPSPPILFDVRNLDYVFATDPNLLCPICHSPLVSPVQTKCLHTFCSSCISTSLERSATCPVDRKPLDRDDVTPAPIMITNLVNDLIVLCPNADKGCSMTFSRFLVEGHLKEECGYQLVGCNSEDVPDCVELVMRKDNQSKQCMHKLSDCKHCEQQFRLMDLPAHEEECPKISTTCEHCSGESARSEIREHIATCPCVIEECPAAKHGCPYTSMRSEMPLHEHSCAFVQLSPLLQAHADRISRLELENRSVRKKIELLLPLTRRAKSDDTVDIETQTYHLFAEQEHLRGDVDRISAMVADMEVKQTMLLMNENIRYNEEMAGMRLAINALRMQINFLAASRANIASAAGPSSASGGASASGGTTGGGHPAERRLSGIKL